MRPRPWIVTKHGPVETLDEGLWAVESPVPGLPGLKRRMVIVRRADGSLLFYNAVPVDEATQARILTLGHPRELVVPQHLHMLDAYAFRAKLGVRVFAPAKVRAFVASRVPVDGALDDLPRDEVITAGTIAGFRTAEGYLAVRSGARVSLVFGDVVVNVPHGPGLRGLLFRLLGFTGDAPRLPFPVRLRVLRDRAALRAQLEVLAATPGLARLVPSHGAVVEHDPAGALRRIAASL